MRLAVDARTIFSVQRRGIGKSLAGLYRQVMALRPDWQVIAFHRDPAADASLLPGAELRLIEAHGDRWNVWQRWRLPWAAWRAGADVLHCPANDSPGRSWVPTVVTIHDLIPLENYRSGRGGAETRGFERAVRRACRRAAVVVCPSPYTRDRIVERIKVDGGKLRVVPWGAPPMMRRLTLGARRELLERHGLSQPYAVHFAAAEVRKNTRGLIEAWAAATRGSGGVWQLALAGVDENSAAEFLAQARELGVEEGIKPLGFVSEADVPGLLNGAAFLAYPSLAEGFGVPILEAWAAGTAVLTSDVTSLPGVAGDAALLIDPRSADSLRAGLARMMADEGLLKRLIAAGHRRVKAFTWRQAARRFVKVVEEVAGLERAPSVATRRRRRTSLPAMASSTAVGAGPVDVLVVCPTPLWPMNQGHRVHGPQMARALHEAGLRVAVACMDSGNTPPPALLREFLAPWPNASEQDLGGFRDAAWQRLGGRLRRRMTRHFAVSEPALAGIVPLVRRYRPRVVLGVGLLAPLLLQGIGDGFGSPRRVWYAADELVYFHASCLRRQPWRQWPRRLRAMVTHGLYERAFAECVDGAVAASELDAKLLRRLAGIGDAAVIRNGVDLKSFAPSAVQATPRTVAFWGRLDFEPNIDAVCWFAQHVWPKLRGYRPGAKWQIIGKNPDARVRALGGLAGVELVGAVRDVRPYARRAAVVVLPMRCGGGIKNKLLEAAALGRPIVASPRAVRGLKMDKLRRPLLLAESTDEWVAAVRRLWGDADAARRLGAAARAWAQANHNWATAAQEFCRWLDLKPLREGVQLPGGRVASAVGIRRAA